MEVLERISLNSDWITILLVTLIAMVFFLKLLNAKKLESYALSMFQRRFILKEMEEEISFLDSFQVITSLFSTLVFSLLIYYLSLSFSLNFVSGPISFSFIFLGVLGYFVIKRGLEFLMSLLFEIKPIIGFFLMSKLSYLYSVSFFLLFALFLFEYSRVNIGFLLCFSGALFFLRSVLIFVNNKKLIFSKLFYFILYICSFEIAPLFILFKLMF
ncbi:DUF4271 domain-containing protein [Polaribacter sargassicola]|uniref:DUF4271 domain-containing protein n=1 Tax=Polaribacter sargassicola TaxID=2836891 RepID=UPI0034D3521C|nr:DUF4271 domain-containing protein [Polaribacter sp. DS7-9]